MSQPQPMKLWEAVSAFREFKPVLVEIFGSERWSASYGESFSRYDELVRTQDRATLDSRLPVELTRAIARRCDGFQFYFCAATRSLRRDTSLGCECGRDHTDGTRCSRTLRRFCH
jgi:hypothetical protein